MKLLCVVATLAVSVPAWAQSGKPQSPDELDKDVAVVPFKKGEAFKGGRLVYVDGVAENGRDVRFGLEGLTITQPVTVSILSKDPLSKLQLTAAKWGGSGPGKQVETSAQGAASVAFRVQGDAQLVVRGAGAKTPFQLMIWVGPELKPPLKAPFSSAKADALRSTTKGGK